MKVAIMARKGAMTFFCSNKWLQTVEMHESIMVSYFPFMGRHFFLVSPTALVKITGKIVNLKGTVPWVDIIFGKGTCDSV